MKRDWIWKNEYVNEGLTELWLVGRCKHGICFLEMWNWVSKGQKEGSRNGVYKSKRSSANDTTTAIVKELQGYIEYGEIVMETEGIDCLHEKRCGATITRKASVARNLHSRGQLGIHRALSRIVLRLHSHVLKCSGPPPSLGPPLHRATKYKISSFFPTILLCWPWSSRLCINSIFHAVSILSTISPMGGTAP